MLTLIIAEDEDIIRETIIKIIDWESVGVKLIGSCKDGIEAYHMILDENPNIVLTDIKMPGMTGLELIEKILKTDLVVEFILLSGYADFSFAKKAMAFHVRNYLTKPCNETEIANAISEACQDYYRHQQIKTVFPELSRGYVSAKKDSNLIEEILTYIDENLEKDNLTLKYIAEKVIFMNSDYIGKLFVRQTGEKFSSYLTKKRIQKAKKLILLNPNVKMIEVAESVGCGNNPQYFGQIFKKETGITPSAYAIQQKNLF